MILGVTMLTQLGLIGPMLGLFWAKRKAYSVTQKLSLSGGTARGSVSKTVSETMLGDSTTKLGGIVLGGGIVSLGNGITQT